MTKNMGQIDRILRAVIGVVLLAIPFATALTAGSTLLSGAAIVVGLVMLGTALVGNCPLYSALGLKTSE